MESKRLMVKYVLIPPVRYIDHRFDVRENSLILIWIAEVLGVTRLHNNGY
jgi:hypothetical protein